MIWPFYKIWNQQNAISFFHPWTLSEIIKFSNPITTAVNDEHLVGAASPKLILKGRCVIIIIKMCESNAALEHSWVRNKVDYRHHKIATGGVYRGSHLHDLTCRPKAVNLISIAEKNLKPFFPCWNWEINELSCSLRNNWLRR